ncbi:hypothetical protein CBOM_07524 [Ceraceosorus bombacis]|uniref:Uncharacterized protein n=1 Tax=Ceraceosorus bombacis TaxID=401625 RepID=A0A0P1BDP3_9BASI|nr:hypothetical protein CBOM_07524 [Ceraceosorus bombacis]
MRWADDRKLTAAFTRWFTTKGGDEPSRRVHGRRRGRHDSVATGSILRVPACQAIGDSLSVMTPLLDGGS